MQNVVLFALLGLGTGALVAAIAVAVVITYRGSGTVNVATGATAMVAGYAFWAVRTGWFGPALVTPGALAVALVVAVVFGVAADAVAFNPLRAAPPLARVAASLGVLLTAQAGVLLSFGTSPKPVPRVLPTGTVEVLDARVPVDRFLLAGGVVLITAALWALYRWTRFGIATRAASEDVTAAQLAGLSPRDLSFANTALASLVAGLAGVLSASLVQLDASALPLQIVPALAAVLFARFTSVPIACGSGLLIGVAQSLVYYASTLDWFPRDQGNAVPGVQPLLVLVIMVIALSWRGASLPGRGAVVERPLPAVPRPHHVPRTAALATGAGALLLVVLPFDFRQALITSLIASVIVLSYVVITGYVGQISLVQLALSGVAGFTLSHAATDADLGFPLGPLIAIAVTTALGVLTALAARRVRGASLAVITLAAALAIEQAVFVSATLGAGTDGAPIPSPALFGLELGPDAGFRGLDGLQPSPVFGFLVLGVAVAVGAAVAHLPRTSLGLKMLAVRANERAAAAAGIDVARVKLIAFTLSSCIAGIAGVLYGYNFGSVSATRFGALASVGLIAFAYIGGITRVSGAFVAGLFIVESLVPHAMDEWFGVSGLWALLIGGIALVYTVRAHPGGIAGAGRPALARAR